MELIRGRILVAIVVLLSCFCSDFGTAIDTIASTHFIRDPETIISDGSVFRLGFFSPLGSTNRYVGIWYNDPSETVIWVANRNKPLNDSSGIFTISEDGNLVVLNGQKEVLWSSNVANSVSNAVAQLLDSGNLVLNDSTQRISIWESFQEPTDTFLTSMKLSTDLRTGRKVQLTSWKSPSDPSIGSFSAGVVPLNIPEVFIWNDSHPYWRSGPWNGRIFIGIPDMNSANADRFNFAVDNEERITYNTAALAGPLFYFVLNAQGELVKKNRANGKKDWEVRSTFPETACDVYGKCGPFGRCSAKKEATCSCLRGFEPMNAEEWNRGNWTGGCMRKKPLQCERISTTGEVGSEDGFLKVGMMKVPDFAARTAAPENECRDQCLNNCSCIAYAYQVGIGCMKWRGNLMDMQRFSSGGINLYIRLAHSELDKKDMKVVIIVPVVVGTVIIAICAVFSWWWMEKRKALKGKSRELQFDKEEAYPKSSSQSIDQVKLQDLPVFTFEELANATNNFNSTNKLGHGGFGPVYKGKLQDGQEIAVKRLSKASGQGLEEFMNEVVVISKLQHRNLVRLLGCCIEREEKMLIYEYMPNKSLDAFLFDPLKQELLNWRTRFSIVDGISRGLLYLHRDSRLRIIHRDLKASNILLDEELNPKISDFGMARIFGGNEEQANTIRVVGTYGYMSPEYAMEGRFSEKSDVFSFGVLLLEIVSGRRNTSFYHDEDCLNLLSYAWKLWNENNIVTLIDPVISESGSEWEILRCIHVGLLCVQDFMKDRPTMSTVISMLNSEIVDLPAPRQPAFTERRSAFDTESSEQDQQRCTVNNVTVTDIEAR